eukprot:444507_1
MSEMKAEQRLIGRWTIGATLRKKDYSWIKRGQDIKTGKIVALEFIDKADVSWNKEQVKHIETKIEALKHIRHQNVLKLYTYNLNAQYPLAASGSKTDQKYMDTILLVSEYTPESELFNILYGPLQESVARTYFKQIMNGLEACHDANVIHRDLKPQYLLLDAKYNIKISDFGLTKSIMKNTVEKHYYQAPELLLNQKYDLKCDIFSAGVILFILMAGYPPFEHAAKTDKWYKPLMEGDIDRFWKWHQKSPIAQKPDAKDLLQRMMCFEPKKRIDMNGMKNHKWMKGETLKQKELIGAVHDAQRKAEKKRRRDVRKMNDLAQTLLPCTRIPGIEKRTPELFPEGYSESMFREAYTYLGYKQKWYDLVKLIEEAITGKGKGKATLKYDENILNCEMTVLGADMDIVQFDAEIFLSRVWKDRYLERADKEEIKDENEHQIFVVRMTR